MSWARDEWKENLSAQALKKVSEYEQDLERSRKELQQRQFQLDSLNAALQKQKYLTEEEKNNANLYKRDLQVVSQKCDELEKTQCKVMTDLQMKESRIKCLDGHLTSEKQAKECEIAKCTKLRQDLDTNTLRYDHLLNDYNKLQRELQIEHRKNKETVITRNGSYCSSGESDTEKDVFKAPRMTPVRSDNKPASTPLSATRNFSNSSDDMNQSFILENKIKELQRTIESVRKEKDSSHEKCVIAENELVSCRSKLEAMETKQKQLVQQLDCSRHNVEATRRHQEEKMKEKEREYREEISTQNKELVQLEQQLKETKTRLDQLQINSENKLKESEINVKKIQKECDALQKSVRTFEQDKTQQNILVEKYEKNIAEMTVAMDMMKKQQDVVGQDQNKNLAIIEKLNNTLEETNHELEANKQLVDQLRASHEISLVKEREKSKELINLREQERDDVIAKLKAMETSLDESSMSNCEKQGNWMKQIEDLTIQIEKSTEVLKQREQSITQLNASVVQKDQEIQKLEALVEQCSDPGKIKVLSEEKVLLEGKMESMVNTCNSLKQELAECQTRVSEIDAQRQMLQMDVEDKDEVISLLEQQKVGLESWKQSNVNKLAEQNDMITTLSGENDSMKATLVSLEDEMSQRNRKEKELGSEVTQLRSILENETSQKASLCCKLDELMQERDAKYSYYEGRVEELEKTLNETRNAQDFAETSVIHELKDELSKAKKQGMEKFVEFEELEIRTKSLQQEMEQTQMQLEQATKDMECVRTNMDNIVNEKARLLNELEESKQSCDKQAQKVVQLQTVLAEKERLFDSMEKENREVVTRQEEKIKLVENKVEQLTKECDEKNGELQKQFDMNEEFRSEQSKLSDTIKRLTAELLEKNQERQRFMEERKDSELLWERDRAEIKRLESELSVAFETAQKERACLEERCKDLNNNLLHVKDSTQEQNKSMDELRGSMDSLQAENEQLAVMNKELTCSNKSYIEQITSIEAQCEEYSKKVAVNEKILEEYKINIDKLSKEHCNKTEDLESSLVKVKDDLTRVEAEVASKKGELCQTLKDLEEQRSFVTSLNDDKEKLEEELKSLTSDRKLIDDKYKSALLENKILVNKRMITEEEMEKYKYEVEQLKKELGESQAQVELAKVGLQEDNNILRSELVSEREKLMEANSKLCEKETALGAMKVTEEALQFQITNLDSEKQVISNKMEHRSQEMKQLKEQLSASEDEKMDIKLKLENVEHELESMKESVENKHAQVNDTVLGIRNELAKEKQDLVAAKQNQQEMEVVIQALNSDKETLQFKIDTLTSEKDDFAEKLTRTTKEISSLIEKLAQSEQMVVDLNITVEQLEDKIATTQHTADSTHSSLSCDIDNLRAELSKEKMRVEASSDVVMEKDVELKSIVDEKESLEFQLSNLKKEHDENLATLENVRLENKVSIDKTTAYEQHVNEMTLAVQRLQEELEITKSKSEANQMMSDESLESLQYELAETRGALETTRLKLAEEESTVQMLNEKEQTLLFQLENMRSKEKSELERFEKIVEEARLAQEKLLASEQLVKEHLSTVEQLTRDLNDARDNLEVNESTADGNMTRLRNELEQWKEKMEEASAALKEKESVVQVFEKEKELSKFQLEEVTLEKKECSLKIESMLEEQKDFNEKIRSAEEEIRERRSSEERLRQEMVDLRNGNEITEATFNENIRKLENEITQNKVSLEKMTSEASEQKSVVRTLTNEKEQLVFEVENLKTGKQEIAVKLEETSNECRIHLEKLVMVEQEMAGHKMIVEELKVEKNQLEMSKGKLEHQIDLFNDTIQKLRQEVLDGQQKLDETNERLTEKETLVSSLKNEKESVFLEMEKLRSDHLNISEKLEEVKEKCNVYEGQLCESSKLAKDYVEKERSLQDMQEELKKKKAELEESQMKYEEMKERMSREVVDLKALLESKENCVIDNVHELSELKTELELQIEKVNKIELENRKQDENNMAKIAESEKTINELRRSCEAKTKETKDALEKYELLQVQFDKKVEELLSMEKEFENERRMMVEQVKNAAEDFEEIKRNVFCKEETIISLEKQLMDTSNVKDQEYNEAVSFAKEEREKLSEKVYHISNENRELKAEIFSTKTNLERQLKIKQERIIELERDFDKSKEENAGMERKHIKQVRDLENELNGEREKVTTSCRRIDDLLASKREEHDAMSNAERDFTKVRGELENEIKTLRGKLTKQDDILQEYRSQKGEYERVLSELEKTTEALDKSNDHVASLKDSLNEYTLQKQNLQLELTKTVEDNEVLVKSAKQEKSDLEHAIDKYKSTIEDLEMKVSEAVKEIAEQRSLLASRNNEILSMKEELSSKSVDIERLEVICEKGKDVESELRNELDKVINELEDYRNQQDKSGELEEANKKIAELKKEIENQNQKLQEEREEIMAKTKEFVLQRENEYSEKAVRLEQELGEKVQMLAEKCEEINQLSHRLENEQKSKEILMNEMEDREKELEDETSTWRLSLTPNKLQAIEADLEEERKMTKQLREKCTLLDEVVLKEQTDRVSVQRKLKALEDERSTLEQQIEKIPTLENQIETVTQQIDNLKTDLNAEKATNAVLENELTVLKERETNLGKLLEDQMKSHEKVERDYEQLKQKENDITATKKDVSDSSVNTQQDSMKVCQLECYVSELKNTISEQEKKVNEVENTLQRTVSERDQAQCQYNDVLTRNENLSKKIEEHMKELSGLKEAITTLEKRLVVEQSDNEKQVSFLKDELSAQAIIISELRDKIRQLQALLDENVAILASKEQAIKQSNDELSTTMASMKAKDEMLTQVSGEMEQLKKSLSEANEGLKFLETLKEEVMTVEEKCSSWRGKCGDLENKLKEEVYKFSQDRKKMEEEIRIVTCDYEGAKERLQAVEEEQKPMTERLLHLEAEMIMMPNVDKLQKELDHLKKELRQEKENTAKYEKLSQEYCKRLEEIDVVKEAMSSNTIKDIPRKSCSAVVTDVQRNGHITPPDQPLVNSPSLMDEQQVFLSPMTRSFSNLGFETPENNNQHHKPLRKSFNQPTVEGVMTRSRKSIEDVSKQTEVNIEEKQHILQTKTPKTQLSVQIHQMNDTNMIRKKPELVKSVGQRPLVQANSGGFAFKKDLTSLKYTKQAIKDSTAVPQTVETVCRLPKTRLTTSNVPKTAKDITYTPKSTLATSKIPDSSKSNKATAAVNAAIKKRKEDIDVLESKSKRLRVASVNSPFVLERKTQMKTRNKTSTFQSRLVQPRTRSQLQGSNQSRIQKPTATSKPIATSKGFQATKSKQSADECKMQ